MGKCSKDKRDIFYRLAKEEGWRARSAFKLLQIEDQFGIFNGVSRAVDLCAAPGSWSQVLVKKLGGKSRQQTSSASNEQRTCDESGSSSSSTSGDLNPSSASRCSSDKGDNVKIVAVDIQTMAPIEGVTQIQGDITDPATADKVIKQFDGCKAQLIVCDGAPDVTGQHDLDEFMQSQLLLAALNITTFILETGGTLVAKIFRGKDITLMIAQLRLFFGQVQVVKPKSSRTSSIEAFVVCRDFQMPPNYKPRMFDLLTNFDSDHQLREELASNSDARALIPFLMCGDLNELKLSQKPGEISRHQVSSVTSLADLI